MDYKKKLRARLKLYITYLVLGLAMILISFFVKSDADFLSAFGFATALVGAVRIRNYYIVTRSEESLKAHEIAEKDERNILIAAKARGVAFSVTIIISALTVIILSCLNMHDQARWVSLPAASLLLVYWVSYFIYRKKM